MGRMWFTALLLLALSPLASADAQAPAVLAPVAIPEAPAAAGQEAFPAFFGQFIRRKSFAMARTRYPLRLRSYAWAGEKGREHLEENVTEVSRAEGARYPTLMQRVAEEGLRLEYREPAGDEATVTLREEGSPQRLEHVFLREAGRWSLVEVRDRPR